MRPGRSWITSIAVNIIILVTVMVFTDMTYETNDDYAISNRIVSGDACVGFVDFVMSYILVYAQKLTESVNVFVLFQIVLSFSSMTVILKVFLDKGKSLIFTFCLIALLTVFAFDLYSVIQFTKTSAVTLCAAMLLLIDTVTEEPESEKIYSRSQAIDMVIALFLVYTGAGLRIENLPIAIGFAGIFLIMWIVENRRDLISGGYLKPKRIAVYVMVIILLGGSAGMFAFSAKMNVSTTQLNEYQEYNLVRSNVIDFSQADHFDEHAEDYKAAGLSKNDIRLIDKWYLDYDGAASYDNLKKIDEIYGMSRDEKNLSGTARAFVLSIYESVKNVDKTGIHLLILLGIGLVCLFRMKPRYLIYVMAVGAALAGIYFALFYAGRIAYRATFAADISAAMWILYAMDEKRLRKPPGRGVINVAGGVIACMVLAAGIYLEYGYSSACHDVIKVKIRPEALSERIAEDTDHMYVFSPAEKNNLSSYEKPLLKPEEDANVISFGSWGTKSPYVAKKIGAYGLHNLFGDIIDNDSVFVIEDRNVDRMEEYLNKWYSDRVNNKTIRYVKEDEIDGYSIWKVRSQ